jgi:hypothetical protein
MDCRVIPGLDPGTGNDDLSVLQHFIPEDLDIDSRTWMPGSSPGMTVSFLIRPLNVMAGLDPAIHAAARTVTIRVFWYYRHGRA